jgi:hypothetical protein
MKIDARDWSSLTDLRLTWGIALCHWLAGVTPSRNKGHTLFLKSWAWWSAFLTASSPWADRCCWRAGLVPTRNESGVARLGWQKKAEALSTSRTISGVGSKRLLRLSPMVQLVRCRIAHLALLIFSKLVRDCLSSPLILELAVTPQNFWILEGN